MYRWMKRAGVVLALVLAACNDSPTEVQYPDVDRVEVGPADRVITIGDTMRLTAYPRAADGSVLGSVAIQWSSADSAIASVRPNGLVGVVQAKAPGLVRIEAESGGRTGSVLVKVIAAPLQVRSVDIVPSFAKLQVGQQFQIEARVLATDGTIIGGRAVTWTSSSGPVVTVTGNANNISATLTAHAVGVVTISAQVDSLVGEMRVEVITVQVPVGFVIVQPARRGVWQGKVVSYASGVSVHSANGSRLEGRAVTWSVEDTTVAQVDGLGNVRGLRPGVTRVRATSEGVTGQAELTVFAVSPTGHDVFDLTYDWWDGTLRLAHPVGIAKWADENGVQHDAPLYLTRGSITFDRSRYPNTYERVLIAEAWATVNGVGRKVAEERYVERGTFTNVIQGGETLFLFRSQTTPGLTYDGKLRGAGEVLVKADVGAGILTDVLFRMRQ